MRRAVLTIVFNLQEDVGLKEIKELAILEVFQLVLCILVMFEIV
jgi:hypothetical protein